MCGICGFIGQSTQPGISFRLLTHLFEESQSRGIDASGYWGTTQDGETIVYHKEPIKANEFIKKSVWKNLGELQLDLMLVHARGASTGVGLPSDNKNNHPFTSSCKCIGMVHNGRIPDHEYDNLKKKYEVYSHCDSEVILRIFEAALNYEAEVYENYVKEYQINEDRAKILVGLKDIWSMVDKGAMAVAVGHRIDKTGRELILFRNSQRPLWLVDLRTELGQVFFCSTPEIWKNACNNSGLNRIFKKQVKLVELPTEEIWLLNIDENTPVVDKIKKFDVVSKGKVTWEHTGEQIKISKKETKINLLTKLDEKENLIVTKKEQSIKKIGFTGMNGYDYADYNDDTEPFSSKIAKTEDDIESVNSACQALIDLIKDLGKAAEASIMEGRLKGDMLKELLTCMETQGLDIEASIKLIP